MKETSPQMSLLAGASSARRKGGFEEVFEAELAGQPFSASLFRLTAGDSFHSGRAGGSSRLFRR